MSQTAPPPRSSFLQIMLIASVFFLGYMLLFGQRGPADTRTADELLEAMKKANAELRDVTIVQLNTAYQGKVRSEARTRGWSDEEVRERIAHGDLLVANTQYQAAKRTGEVWRMNNAYLTLEGRYRRQAATPEWTKAFPVHASPWFERGEISMADQYHLIVRDLSAMYRRDLVWGLAPGWQIIDALVALTGRVPGFSYWFMALLLAVMVRAIVWPLVQRQLLWSRRMQQLQPLVKELQETCKDKKTGKVDNQLLQTKVMELYKEYGFNPFSGCWPILVQMPLFIFVYQCLVHYRFELKNGTFLWINPVTSDATNGFVARSLGDMDYLLIVVYGISMIVTTLLQPVSDPTQVRQQRFLGIFIAVFFSIMMFFWPLPSAFVLYWIFTNILATTQILISYRQPVPPLVKVNAPHGAVLPVNGTTPPNGAASPKTPLFGRTGGPQQRRKGKSRKKR